MRMRHKTLATQGQKAGLAFRLKAVQFLAMSEPDLARLIFKIETDPLFEKIKCFLRRVPARGPFYLPGCGAQEPGVAPDVAWAAYGREVALIQKIGRAKFEKYFLYGDTGFSAEEVAARTGLTFQEARQVRGFVFAVAMQAHSMRAIPDSPAPGLRYSCVARIELSRGKPALQWLLPHLARGRYEIDQKGLAAFQKEALTTEEQERMQELTRTIKLVNLRQAVVIRLVELILKEQRRFFQTGGELRLVPLTASEAARKLKVHPSTISRCAAGRTLLTPQGKELPLDFFLPNRKRMAVHAIKKLLEQCPGATDESLGYALLSCFNINISRRSVNVCRRAAQTLLRK